MQIVAQIENMKVERNNDERITEMTSLWSVTIDKSDLGFDKRAGRTCTYKAADLAQRLWTLLAQYVTGQYISSASMKPTHPLTAALVRQFLPM